MTRTGLYEKHVPLALAVARDFYLPGAQQQDVEQEARIALWIATGDHNPARGPFLPFARLVVRRRLVSILKAALAEKHRPLNEAVLHAVDDDGNEVSIVDTLPGGRDPLELVLARESWDRICAAASRLSDVEREALELVVAGEPYRGNKRIDNAVQRARKRLAAVA